LWLPNPFSSDSHDKLEVADLAVGDGGH